MGTKEKRAKKQIGPVLDENDLQRLESLRNWLGDLTITAVVKMAIRVLYAREKRLRE